MVVWRPRETHYGSLNCPVNKSVCLAVYILPLKVDCPFLSILVAFLGELLVLAHKLSVSGWPNFFDRTCVVTLVGTIIGTVVWYPWWCTLPPPPSLHPTPRLFNLPPSPVISVANWLMGLSSAGKVRVMHFHGYSVIQEWIPTYWGFTQLLVHQRDIQKSDIRISAF